MSKGYMSRSTDLEMVCQTCFSLVDWSDRTQHSDWHKRLDSGAFAQNPDQESDSELVKLLHEIDGHLGLAVHRGNGHEQWWREEAAALITRIRAALQEVENQ